MWIGLRSAFFNDGQKIATFWLNRKVDVRGRAAEGGRNGTRIEVVSRGGACKRRVEVDVRIDQSRQNIFSLRIDSAPGLRHRRRRADRSDFSAIHGNVVIKLCVSRHHMSTA